MGIDYKAVLVVGLPDSELDMERNEDGYYDEDDILQMVPPYYDADEGVVGIEVFATRDYDYKEVDLQTLTQSIDEAKATFELLTGKEGKLYLSPKGW